jgi:uncharacterized membrane protein
MKRCQQPALTAFAIGMIGMGVLALIYGDFALVWQPVPQWVPGRTALAYASGVIMVLGGFGLLARATRPWAVRILFPYLIIWALLKVPALVVAPKIEAVWLGFGELAVLMAGGWVLFARLAELPDRSALAFLTTEKSVWVAQKFLAVWLIPIGLSHIFYVQPTVDLVPAWLPYREGWAYLTGAGHIAAGLGILFSIFPRVAAYAEAAMIGVFTLLVWVPKIVATPKTRLPWTAFFISWVIAAAAWVVAQNLVSGKPTEQMASKKTAAV